MHINEGKGQLALFYTANNVLLTHLLFIFVFLLLHNFIIFVPQFFIPSSTISQFLLFSLLNLNFPPPPQFFYIPSSTSTSTSTSSFILYIFPSTIHRPPIDPTSTPHRPHIDPTSIPHRPYIDPTSTPYRPYIVPTSTPHRP